MDIHRCRFVPYPASAINAVAFSHPHLSTSKHSNKTVPARLAIGRANGDIEIWNPLNGSWYQEIIIHGGKDRSVDGLVWLNGEDEELDNGKVIHGRSRLFSIGYTTTVTEWDLENARAKRHASGQHGDIWCLGAQPRSASGSSSQKLVGGTMDGSLVLYSTDDDDLRFQRLYRSHGRNVKMVSITFQSRHIAVVGCSDGAIRVFDVRNGSMPKTMTLGRDLAGGSKDVIVWSVKCLPNGDIVSGDSTGQICIWDGKTYTQAQRIQGHTQDVLSLATSADGSSIISGGMDRRTVLYREIPGRASRWAKMWHRRYHTHDVKAMAAFEAKGISVVVTGGPDATPIVIPLRKSGSENHRTLSHLPQTVPLASARNARLLIGWWEREVHIWELRKPINEILVGGIDTESQVDQNRKLLGRISIKGDSNITAADISSDGSLVVVSTASEVKAFQLKQQHCDDGGELRISKVALPPPIATHGATKLGISPDGLWVCLAQGGSRLTLAKVNRHGITAGTGLSIDPRPLKLDRLKRDVPKHLLLGGLGSYDRHIMHIAFAPDSRVLATADLAGYIDTWVLRGTAGSLQNGVSANEEGDASSGSSSSSDDDSESESSSKTSSWIRNPKARLVPKLPATPVALSFSDDTPGSSLREDEDARDYALLAVMATSELLAFHPLRGKLTSWSRRLRLSKLPLEYRNICDLVKGVIWQGPRVWLYGPSFLFMFDTSIEPDKVSAAVVASSREGQGVKRKRGAGTGAGGKMEMGALEPQHVRMAVNEGGDNKWVDVEMEKPEGSADDNDDDSDGGELQSLRDEQGVAADREGEAPPQRRWWSSLKFRPILGIVPLATAIEPSNQGEAYPPLEVALVERPTWDIDLPERYVGDDERD